MCFLRVKTLVFQFFFKGRLQTGQPVQPGQPGQQAARNKQQAISKTDRRQK